MRNSTRPRYVLYLAVVPFYRQHCIDALTELLGDNVQILTGADNIDPTVTTGIDPHQYTRVNNRFVLKRRILIQTGEWRTALAADTLILDLNPRNVSVWTLSTVRRLLHRRTLLWGHLHPRGGAQSRTSWLRRALRRLGNGTILYSYDEVPQAKNDLPAQDVWVAPNSLYRSAELEVSQRNNAARESILYVGRLVDTKKVDLLLRGYARSALDRQGVTLSIVGAGAARPDLETLAERLGCTDSVTFAGKITDPAELREIYAGALCSVSPGYAGLSLTQSLGFGVPMIVADKEPHAPEIELARFDGVSFFAANDPDSLAASLISVCSEPEALDSAAISASVRKF